MALRGFQPKVKQLEQVKIEFDEAEVEIGIPKTIESKKKV